MSTNNHPYYVSLQHYYYSGLYAVEVAKGGLDYAGSDMLSTRNPQIAKLEGSYNNPREAMQAAFEIREIWQVDKQERIYISYGSNLDMIEGSSELDSELSLEDEIKAAIAWADSEYASLEKCDRCGEILSKDYYIMIDFDEDAGKFCSEVCTEYAYAAVMMDLEEESE